MSENPTAPGLPGDDEPGRRRIGVYICHCGGNISDYVDVARVRAAIADDPDVVVAETTTSGSSLSASRTASTST